MQILQQFNLKGTERLNEIIEYFNLDVIISVGYRIKSQRGTQFRIWANKILKDYLIQGFSINEHRLLQQNEQLRQLQESVKMLGNVLKYKNLSGDESTGLLKIISDYFFNSQLTPSLPSLISNPMAASSLRILSEVAQSLLALASARSFISRPTTSFRTSPFPDSA